MNPYAVLGLHNSASKEQAKDAYRKLAMEHHPDREGGNEAKFKEIKEAWESIDRGWAPPPPEPPAAKSSFSADAPKTKAQHAEKPKGAHAGKPAPGYEARGAPPPMPKTSKKLSGGRDRYEVKISITQDQAFEGCVVPFIHNGKVLDYEVRPGSTSRNETLTFPLEQMIGAGGGFVSVEIHLAVLNQKSAPNEQTRDAEITANICALGLFIGGKITVVDHLGERIPVSIPAGYDPRTPIVIKERGFGMAGKRGTLYIHINPVFKVPSELNSHELVQLKHLNDMAKK